MNVVGLPRGPNKDTLLKQHEAREQADPSLREERLQDEGAEKRALVGMLMLVMPITRERVNGSFTLKVCAHVDKFVCACETVVKFRLIQV
jgi:hypothetical protein